MLLGLIGAGAMGGAILRGVLQHNRGAFEQIIVVEKQQEKLRDLQGLDNLTITTDLKAVLQCDLVVVAVKPADVAKVMEQIRTTQGVIVSIAAGITLSQLTQWRGDSRVVRAMPNTPALLGQGVTALAFGKNVDSAVQAVVEDVFRNVGRVVTVQEDAMDVVTALSGCGPAYVYLLIEALIDAGCAHGLSRDVARELIAATFKGSAQMVLEGSQHPAELKDKVTSPGGVTIQALHVLESHGVRGILWDTVDRVVAVSKRLGQQVND